MSAIIEALAAFQADMPTVPKNRVVGNGPNRYTYADLADVTAAALPLLNQHDLVFVCQPRQTAAGYELVGTLRHTSGERIKGALPIHGRHMQDIGSAITYARRYLLGCLTGIITDDDDDGQAARDDLRADLHDATAAVDAAQSLFDAIAAASTVEELTDIYESHQVGKAPEEVRAAFNARVTEVKVAADV